jgi:hypothetical protein
MTACKVVRISEIAPCLDGVSIGWFLTTFPFWGGAAAGAPPAPV